MRMRHMLITALATAATALLLAWLLTPHLQELRANQRLTDANNHIAAANRQLANVQLGALDQASLSSLESINQAQQDLAAALPLLQEASHETGLAIAKVSGASRLYLLPQWYRDYLAKKSELAQLRREQLQYLEDIALQLQALHGSGTVIFAALDGIDRLLGQLQTGISKTRSNPGEAKAALEQVALSFQDIERRLEERYQQTGFELLERLAGNARTDAEVASVSARLSQASAAGDQAQAQQLAGILDAKIGSVTDSKGELDRWWQAEIEPLREAYNQLEERQRTLDAEAAELYDSH